jgi:two-component system, NtrC family, response regulator AtoC
VAVDSVLLIDGDPETRNSLSQGLREAGFATVNASTGPEGLGLLSTWRPRAVVLDLELPGTDPLALLHQIRLEATDAAVVAMSREQEPAAVVKALRAGATDFVGKPVEVGSVVKAVQNVMSRGDNAVSVGVLTPAGGPAPDAVWPDMEALFGGSPAMQAVSTIVRRAADTNATILLQGESGSGKELVARAIHALSGRRSKPFLKLNCASLPGELLESELFGHEPGAFTGAQRRKLGRFELAHGGTLLLEEVGDMPLPLQGKLVHALQDGRFFRAGSSEAIEADVRLVAATSRDLGALTVTGTFREDLYYRVNVVTISVPPLRDRREEIPRLVAHFVEAFARQYARPAPAISLETMRLLQEYGWPGNVRELENMIKRLVVLQSEGLVRDEIALRRQRTVPPGPTPTTVTTPPATPRYGELGLKEIAKRAAMEAEKAVLREVLDRVRWNRAEAARILKISYKALLYKIAAAGLDGKGEKRNRSK